MISWRSVGAAGAFLAVLLLSGFCSAAERALLSPGESFDYGLYFHEGPLPIPAGEARLSTSATTCRGRSAIALQMEVKASSIIESFYHLRTSFTSVVTPALQSLGYVKRAEEGSRTYTESATFDYQGENCIVSSRRSVRGGKVQTGRTVRKGRVYDLVNVCFFARVRDLDRLSRGAYFPVAVASGVSVRERRLVYHGVQMGLTAEGTRMPCHVLVLLAKDEHKRDVESARFWISRDDRRMPVRIDMVLKFGTASVRLRKRR